MVGSHTASAWRWRDWALVVCLLCATPLASLATTFCRSASECLSTVISDDFIYCDGEDACYGSVLFATSNLFCRGQDACRFGQINAGRAYCYGYLGCDDAVIATEDLYCRARWGCADMNLTPTPGASINDLVCTADSACRGGTVNLPASLSEFRAYCDAQRACYDLSLAVMPGVETLLVCRGHQACRFAQVSGSLTETDFTLFCDETGCDDLTIDIADGRGMNFSVGTDQAGFTLYAEKIDNATVVSGTAPGQFTFGYYDYDGDGMPDMQNGCTAALLDCTALGYTIDDDDDNDGVPDVNDSCHDTGGVGGSTIGGTIGTGSGPANADVDNDGCDDATEDPSV